MSDNIIKSYVWHGDKCFFVSTIERDSSVMSHPSARWNETTVWEYDYEDRHLGKMLFVAEDAKGSLATHIEACRGIFECGVKIVEIET